MSAPVTLITGARKGIGRELAGHYLAQGHQVVGCSRQGSDLDHPRYRHFCLDVADEGAVLAMFAKLRADFGSLQNLVNNAGIASMNHCLTTPLRVVESILSTNVVGSFLFCREGAKLMLPRRSGRIVNFTTVATPLKLEGEAAYAASKAAVLSLTQVLAHELSPFGITVNSVGPTPTLTDLIRSVPQEKMDALLARQAIRRHASFQDISNVVDFFLSDASGFVTGQNIYLGGV